MTLLLRKSLTLLALALTTSACAGDGPPPPAPVSEPEPTETAAGVSTEEALRQSFLGQVAATPLVANVDDTDDAVTFLGPDGAGGEASWRVVIDATSIETQPDGTPYRGNVTSSWYRDGELVEPSPDVPTLPEAYLEMGLSQECWALWDTVEQRWSWI